MIFWNIHDYLLGPTVAMVTITGGLPGILQLCQKSAGTATRPRSCIKFALLNHIAFTAVTNRLLERIAKHSGVMKYTSCPVNAQNLDNFDPRKSSANICHLQAPPFSPCVSMADGHRTCNFLARVHDNIQPAQKCQTLHLNSLVPWMLDYGDSFILHLIPDFTWYFLM